MPLYVQHWRKRASYAGTEGTARRQPCHALQLPSIFFPSLARSRLSYISLVARPSSLSLSPHLTLSVLPLAFAAMAQSWEASLPLWTPCDGAAGAAVADYVLHEDTLQWLMQIEQPFRVLSAMGHQRIGKSTSLGMLARGRQDASVFAARRGRNAVTRGLWVCFRAEGASGGEGLLLLDCEGTDNVLAGEALDQRLCALTFFLSHGVIVPYNAPAPPGDGFRRLLTYVW